MNNVIAIKQTKDTMSSTQLAVLLGIEKKEVNRKIKGMFSTEIDGGAIQPSLDSRGYVTDYHLPELETTMFVGKWHTPFLRQLAEFWIENKTAKTATPALSTGNPFLDALLETQRQVGESKQSLDIKTRVNKQINIELF